MNKFKIKTEVRFGENAIDTLLMFKGLNAAVITDSFMNESGAVKMVVDKLSGCKKVDVFDKVIPDPPIALVTEGLRFLKENDTDVVVALGGGSSIDDLSSAPALPLHLGPRRPW